jgi:hypothetical protein
MAATMSTPGERLHRLEAEIERKLLERFAALRDEFDRLRVESDQRWAGYLSRFEQDFKGMVPPELIEAPAPAAAPARGTLSIETARALDEAANQVDVLNKFLELARKNASRSALLIARGDSLGVWKAMGFTEHGGSDEAVRRVALTASADSPLARVLDGVPAELGAGNNISLQLGAADATRAVLVPMTVKEKVSGALYADCVAAEEEAFDAWTLGFLTFLAGLVVDRLATRKLKPAPALKPAEAILEKRRETEAPLDLSEEPEAERAGEPDFGGLVADSTMPPKPSPRMPPPLPPPVPAAPPPLEPVEDTSPRGLQSGLPPAMHLEDSRPGSGFQISRADVLAAAAGTAAAGAPAAPPSVPSPTTTPVSGTRPSLGGRRLAGPLAPAEGDERREEARRFAKLLVSEIKLYNERAVLEGREHGNLYERLKDDIDRSRQMYDERIPEDVRAGSNFFYEELVHILADGRAEALGI